MLIYLSFAVFNNEFVPCMSSCVQAISEVILRLYWLNKFNSISTDIVANYAFEGRMYFD